jgi:hypothetical protein
LHFQEPLADGQHCVAVYGSALIPNLLLEVTDPYIPLVVDPYGARSVTAVFEGAFASLIR